MKILGKDKKRLIAFFLACCITAGLFPAKAPSVQGAEVEVQEIRTAEELLAVSENPKGRYKLMNDIDLTAATATGGSCDINGTGWKPIGAPDDEISAGTAFSGVFDGNGYSVKGLQMRGNVVYQGAGLFFAVTGTVKNVTLEKPEIVISGNASLIGGIAGQVGMHDKGSEGLIENCTVSGGKLEYTWGGISTGDRDHAIGGVAGYMDYGVLSHCSSSAELSYQSEDDPGEHLQVIGGVCGAVEYGSVTGCSNRGQIHANRRTAKTGEVDFYAGGVCGLIQKQGDITQCYNTGDIDVYQRNVTDGFVLNSVVSMTHTGGICGATKRVGKIEACYNTGTVIGKADSYKTFQGFETGQSGEAYAGGIVGYSMDTSSGPVKNCYNTGAINANFAYPIAYGSIPVQTNYYLEGCTKVSKGSSKYDDSKYTCTSMTEAAMKVAQNWSSFDMENTWFFLEGSGMPAPQLLDCPQIIVEQVEFLSGPKKTEYAYGSALDMSGAQVAFTIQGKDTPFVMDIPAGRVTGYNSQRPGEQELTVEYFGFSKTYTVTVGEKPTTPPEDSSSPTPEGSSEPGQTPGGAVSPTPEVSQDPGQTPEGMVSPTPDIGQDPGQTPEGTVSPTPDTSENPGGGPDPAPTESVPPSSGGNQGPAGDTSPTPGISPTPGASPLETEEPDDPDGETERNTYVIKNITYKVINKNTVSVAGATKKNLKTLKIPDTITVDGRLHKVTKIEKRAFKNQSQLKTVSIGNYVKTVGEEAFAKCSKLEQIQFGTDLAQLGKKVFYQDKKLRKIIFKGKKLQKIGKNAFYGVPPQVDIRAMKSMAKKYARLINRSKT